MNPNKKLGDVISHWPPALRPVGVILGKVPFSRTIWASGRLLVDRVKKLSWSSSDALRSLKWRRTSDSRREAIRGQLEAGNNTPIPGCLGSITFASRKLGNQNNGIEKVLASIPARTARPEVWEILVKVDDGDDLSYFNDIKNRFRELNLRIFVTPRGLGYPDLHLFNSFLIDQASESSKAWLQMGDEGLFVRDGWDLEVYDFIEQHEVFVTGVTKFDVEISLAPPMITNPKPVYSYNCTDSPIVSFSLLKGLREAAKGVEDWSTLGNSPWFDAYIANIMHTLHDKHGIKFYFEVDAYCVQLPRKASWIKDPKRVATAVKSFDNFFSESAIATRAQIVAKLFQSGLFQSSDRVDSSLG